MVDAVDLDSAGFAEWASLPWGQSGAAAVRVTPPLPGERLLGICRDRAPSRPTRPVETDHR